MRYIIAPLDLTTEQREVYFLLYSKMDFNTNLVKYTLNQLANDSNAKLELTKKKVGLIIKNFISNELLSITKKGSKGNPTIYKISNIKELNLGTQRELKGNLKGTQRELKRNLKPSNNNGLNTIEEHKRNLKETQKYFKGNLNVTPIIDIDKDKENKYADTQEIFNCWNESNAGIKHGEVFYNNNKNKIKTYIKKYGKEEIIKCIERLSLAVNKKDYFYNNRWNIINFFKQENGIKNWQDEGQLWNQFKDSKESKTEIKKEYDPYANMHRFN